MLQMLSDQHLGYKKILGTLVIVSVSAYLLSCIFSVSTGTKSSKSSTTPTSAT